MKKLLATILLAFVLALATVSALGDLSASFDNDALTGDPGDSVSFTLNADNTGSSDFILDITSTDLDDGTGNTILAPQDDSLAVDAGNSEQTTVDVDIPLGTPVGVYSGTVTVEDELDSSNTEDLTYTVTVNAVDDFQLSQGSLDVDYLPGSSDSFDIVITNTGSTALSTWTVEYSSASGDINFVADTDGDRVDVGVVGTPTSLAPGATATVTVSFDADTAMDSGSYGGGVVNFATGSSASASIPVSINVQAFNDDFSLSTTDLDYNVNAGDSDSQTFQITNDGNTDLTGFAIDFTSDAGDSGFASDSEGDRMDVSFSPPLSNLVPGQTMTITATIATESDLNAGSYGGTMSVSATGNGAVSRTSDFDAVVSVLTDSINTDISSVTTTTSAGSSSITSIVITNTGDTTLTGFAVSYTSDSGESNFVTDAQGDRVDITFQGIPTSLVSGASATLTVDHSVDANMGSATYGGDISITATGSANSVSASVAYDVTVPPGPVDSFSVDTSSLSYDLLADFSGSQTFVITNTGTTTLTGWNAVFTSDEGDVGFMEDNDNDRVTVSLSGVPTSLAAGASATVTVTLDADNSIDEGSNYQGDLQITATGSSSTQSATMPIDVTITPDICSNGIVGNDFTIRLDEPDNGDNFGPGDTITVQVEVENDGNNDLDVEVEVVLYNEDEGKKVKTVRENKNIDENDEYDFDIDLILPDNMDPRDSYVLYVQVHEDGNEDDSCDYETVNIDIELEDEDVKITDATLTPSTGLTCNENYRVSVEVESVGNDALDNVYIEVRDAELGAAETSQRFDLGDYNDNDNDFRVSFDLEVPSDINPIAHYLEAKVFNENGKLLDSELILVDVNSCTSTIGTATSNPTTTSTADGTLKVTVADNYDVSGEDLTLGLVIENQGNTNKQVSIDVAPVDWANLEGTEVLNNLNPGDQVHGYVYLGLEEGTFGEHDLRLTVRDNAGNSVTRIVTVDFGEPSVDEPRTGALDSISGAFTGGAGSTTTWVIIDVILVVLSIVFLRALLRKR